MSVRRPAAWVRRWLWYTSAALQRTSRSIERSIMAATRGPWLYGVPCICITGRKIALPPRPFRFTWTLSSAWL